MARRGHLGDPGGVNRVRALLLVVVAAGAVTIGLLASSASAQSSSAKGSLPALNRQVFAAINAFRTSHGLSTLRDSKPLDKAALAHSLEMGAKGYFAHNSANGEQFFVRVRRYYPSKGYAHWTVGENLLWGAPTVSAAQAMKLWIASPPHLKNLKTATWRDLGVSAVSVANAGGPFGGQTVTIITTDFGVRSK
jgi:uncharacterized protein YkwD